MKYQFIVNPKARSGRGARVWEDLKQILENDGIDFEARCTEYAGQAEEFAAEMTADGEEHLIVALGGDGTVNEVINGILDCSKVVFGYIPTGSGNDFTRALKIPTDPQKAPSGYGYHRTCTRFRQGKYRQHRCSLLYHPDNRC